MTRGGDGSGFGLGDLFRGLGDLIEVLKEMEAEGKTEITRSGELRGKGAAKDLRGVYGFSIKVGLGGEPRVETFGNIRKGKQGPVVEEVREPLVDVFDEGDHLRIVAELPGVDASDVKVELKDEILTVVAQGKDRQYSKELLLPAKGTPESLKTAFRNGILEVTIEKEAGSP